MTTYPFWHFSLTLHVLQMTPKWGNLVAGGRGRELSRGVPRERQSGQRVTGRSDNNSIVRG